MFDKYFVFFCLLIFSHVPTINGNALCSCYCCTGASCMPTYRGTLEILSCDGLSCYNTCISKFPAICGGPFPSDVRPVCNEITTTVATSTASAIPTSNTTATSTTLPTTTTTSETTSVLTTTTMPSTSTTVTESSSSSTQTSPPSSSTTTVTETKPTSTETTTATQPPKSTTTTHRSDAASLRENSSFMALFVALTFSMMKIIF